MKKRNMQQASINVKERAFEHIEKRIYFNYIGPKLITSWMSSFLSPYRSLHANQKLMINLLKEEEE